MDIYYFHLNDSGNVLCDEEGTECADHEGARAYATACARGMMASDVLAGALRLDAVISVHDHMGVLIAEMPFRGAVTVHQCRTASGTLGRSVPRRPRAPA